MILKNGLSCISACCLIISMAACMATPGGQARQTVLSTDVLVTGTQCRQAPESWTASWITSADGLRRMMSRCSTDRIGFASREVPSVDFDRFGVLAVEMGRQSSAGYGFDIGKVTAVAEKQTVTVTLGCRRPGPGAMNAQVITSPWILIRLSAGPYRNIRVVDQDGLVLARIEV